MEQEVQRRVVVTGIGVISPLGLTMDETWSAIVAGRSGIASITRFDTNGFDTTIAAEVRGFDPGEVIGKKDARRMDRYAQFAVAAAMQAAAQAGLSAGTFDATSAGVLIGTGMGAMETIEQGALTLRDQGPKRISPFFAPMALPNMAAGMTAIALGAKGPCFASASACASAAHAIGEATRMIQRGDIDMMFAGGAEAPITPLSVAGFGAMGALSTRNDDPARASRPFDGLRDGFVLAEGGAVLVLEELQHAVERGAPVLGEVVGYGLTDDANHIVQPAPEGEGIARAMLNAIADAGLTVDDIDYINAHGTSTPLNEKFETQGIKGAFGDRAYRIPVSSTKSMTGHLLGAAGAIEAAICLYAMREGVIPPTINQEQTDPECDLDVVPNMARAGEIRYALSNSMGFGGHNVALVLGRAW